MTPTEQDNELREAICDAMHVYPEELKYRLPNSFGNSELEAIMQLITADRKRVALEARIDENNMYIRELTRHYFPSSPSEPHIPLVQFHERIAELKAQQEKL